MTLETDVARERLVRSFNMFWSACREQERAKSTRTGTSYCFLARHRTMTSHTSCLKFTRTKYYDCPSGIPLQAPVLPRARPAVLGLLWRSLLAMRDARRHESDPSEVRVYVCAVHTEILQPNVAFGATRRLGERERARPFALRVLGRFAPSSCHSL
jgi:hypothetical protein